MALSGPLRACGRPSSVASWWVLAFGVRASWTRRLDHRTIGHLSHQRFDIDRQPLRVREHVGLSERCSIMSPATPLTSSMLLNGFMRTPSRYLQYRQPVLSCNLLYHYSSLYWVRSDRPPLSSPGPASPMPFCRVTSRTLSRHLCTVFLTEELSPSPWSWPPVSWSWALRLEHCARLFVFVAFLHAPS